MGLARSVVDERRQNDQVSDTVNSSEVSFDGSAENTLAQLYRSEWQDYLDRFAPYEQQAIDWATDRAQPGLAAARAGESFDVAAQTAQGNLQRDRSRYGLSMTERESATEKRTMGNDQTAAKLQGMNSTRLHVQDQQERVMSGSSAVGLREQIGSGGGA